MNILEVESIHKSFAHHTVLSDLTMNVPEHSVFGFVGQNGSGKTTTMKIILGLLKAEKGTIRVCGETVSYGETKTNRYIGYLPDVPAFYGYMTALEYLKLCGEITGLSKAHTHTRSEELLSLVGLSEVKQKIKGFSRGMKQRLGIAQALLNEPKLLICDEPTSALDPLGRKEILDILGSLQGTTTVIFSTHILSDVERICDRIALLNKGTITLEGSLSEIKEQHTHEGFTIVFSHAAEARAFTESSKNAHFCNAQKIVLGSTLENCTLSLRTSDITHSGHVLLEQLTHMNIIPEKFEIQEPSLESLFMEAVQ